MSQIKKLRSREGTQTHLVAVMAPEGFLLPVAKRKDGEVGSWMGSPGGIGVAEETLQAPSVPKVSILPPQGLGKGHSLWLRSLRHSKDASWELGTRKGLRSMKELSCPSDSPHNPGSVV